MQLQQREAGSASGGRAARKATADELITQRQERKNEKDGNKECEWEGIYKVTVNEGDGAICPPSFKKLVESPEA